MKYTWVLLALLALLTAGIHPIMFKQIKKYNQNNNIILALMFLFGGILALIYIIFNFDVINYEKFIKDKNFKTCCLYIFLTISIIILFNISLLYSIQISPNILYTSLIINLNLLITILFAYLLFNEKINYITFIGVLIVLFGLSIIIYSSNNNKY